MTAQTERLSRLALGFALALLGLWSAAAAGEEAGAAGEALPARLTLRECFRRALWANKDIWVADLRTQASEAGIMSAEGEFDVTTFAEASKGRTNTPVAGVPVGRAESADADVTMGLRKRIVTGTDVEMSASSSYARDLTHTSALNPTYGPEVALSVSQDLLKDRGTAINRTDIIIARNNWEVSKEDLRDSAMQSLLQVERSYWDLYFAMADLEVRIKERARAERLVQTAEGRQRVGDVAPIEVTRAQARAAGQAVDILSAENRVDRLKHRLLRVMGVLDEQSAQLELELVDAPPEGAHRTSLAEAMAVAARRRPDYRQALLAVENAELRERRARNQRLPSLQLFGEYSLAGLGDDLSDGTRDIQDGRYGSWQAGLRFEWPFPNRTARAAYRIATVERRIARVRQEDVLERITQEIADALANLHAAEGRIARAVEAHALAKELLRAEDRSFELGRSNALDLLSAQRDLAAAERDEVGARTDYATALAALYRAQGDLIERKGVALVDRRPAEEP